MSAIGGGYLLALTDKGTPPTDAAKYAYNFSAYLLNTFLTSPIFFFTLPPIFSAAPRSSKSRLLVTCPAFSFTLPLASSRLPFALSFVLESITM